MQQVGVVAIGRNEGDRLRQCLESVVGKVAQVVYVDSGSTDGSVELAQSLSIEVVNLDLSIPFTAARARNEGLARLLQMAPVDYVQFVDGDCEIVEGWLETALQELSQRPELAVVCGRRRERYPDRTLYNQLCDIEWNTPVGEAAACGGDAMMRVTAWQQVGGYNPSLIAGEEPELCLRLRHKGWKIWRLDAEMTLHDAHMTRFSQWWKRMQRAGHAYAEGYWMYGRGPERYYMKETRSIWLWGLGIPLAALVLVWPTWGFSLLLLAVYPLLALKIFRSMRHAAHPPAAAIAYSLSCTVGKFPLLQGQLQFLWNKLWGKHSTLIEYKAAPSSQSIQ